MATQPALLDSNSQTTPRSSNSLAVLFFLLGLPNIYCVLKSRTRQHVSSLLSPGKVTALAVSTATLFLLLFL